MVKELFFGNLNYLTEEEDLKQLLLKYGEVSKVKIIKNRLNGRSKGFAFVRMFDDDATNSVIKSLNGYNFQGRPIRIADVLQTKKE